MVEDQSLPEAGLRASPDREPVRDCQQLSLHARGARKAVAVHKAADSGSSPADRLLLGIPGYTLAGEDDKSLNAR
jgi:hypothetical protein